jgi:esterase/lipase
MIDKRVPAAPPPLNHRCEAGYPAYPRFPSRVLLELDRLQREMMDSLTHVDIPVLLIHSRADRSVPFQSMEQIYEGLATADKEAFVIENADHSVVCDPLRELAFDAIDRFARRVIERRRDDGVG